MFPFNVIHYMGLSANVQFFRESNRVMLTNIGHLSCVTAQVLVEILRSLARGSFQCDMKGTGLQITLLRKQRMLGSSSINRENASE